MSGSGAGGQAEGEALAERLRTLQQRIEQACARAGRDPATVELLAVSKAQPASKLDAAWQAGQRVFGESYVQDWLTKAEDATLMQRSGLRWRFIGALQRNKIRFLLGRVERIDSVDRLKLARELSRRAMERPGGGPQPVLLQVNWGAEPSKAGFLPDALPAAMSELLTLPGLRIDGLMAIPPARPEPEETRADFAGVRALLERLRTATGEALPVLSMGMSSDFEVAIEEGSTEVRLGTVLFGERPARGDG